MATYQDLNFVGQKSAAKQVNIEECLCEESKMLMQDRTKSSEACSPGPYWNREEGKRVVATRAMTSPGRTDGSFSFFFHPQFSPHGASIMNSNAACADIRGHLRPERLMHTAAFVQRCS